MTVSDPTAQPSREAATTPTGVAGRRWRAAITAWGDIVPDDGSATLAWFVAADDRWHRPAAETTLRQTRPQGAPVTETRLRIPGGDAVQRIWSVADDGGQTLMQIDNDSSMPIAVALTRRDLLTSRPPSTVGVEGIDLPADTLVLPVAHRTSVTVSLPHDGRPGGALPERRSTFEAVVRGWLASTERAGRIVVEDDSIADRLTAARADLLLDGVEAADQDPGAWLVGVAELVRLGEIEPGDVEMGTVADAVERVAPDATWASDTALAAAGRLLAAADEQRAGRDLGRIRAKAATPTVPSVDPAGAFVIPAIEQRFARRGDLMPDGFERAWLGRSIEVYGIPTGPHSDVSFALRWHGERPALLWEQRGEPVALSASAIDPDWSSAAPSGEALLAAQGPPPGASGPAR